jgi:hypothetical protein
MCDFKFAELHDVLGGEEAKLELLAVNADPNLVRKPYEIDLRETDMTLG